MGGACPGYFMAMQLALPPEAASLKMPPAALLGAKLLPIL